MNVASGGLQMCGHPTLATFIVNHPSVAPRQRSKRRHRDRNHDAERSQMPKTGSDPDPRFTFANAPTFLAWNRTALALIAAGLAAAQFLKFNLHGLRLIIALPLIVLGAALALASYLHWGDSERAMRLRQPLHYSSRRSDAPVPCDSLLGTA